MEQGPACASAQRGWGSSGDVAVTARSHSGLQGEPLRGNAAPLRLFTHTGFIAIEVPLGVGQVSIKKSLQENCRGPVWDCSAEEAVFGCKPRIEFG